MSHSATERLPLRTMIGRQLPLLVRVLPFALYIALLAGTPGLSVQIDGWGDPRWLYGVRSLLVASLLILFWRHFSELRGQAQPALPEMGLALGVGLLVLLLWLLLADGVFVLGRPGSGFVPLRPDGALDWPLSLLRLTGSAVVVPVMEELFWRSFLMRWLAARDFANFPPARVGWRALLLSSVVFGFEHAQWLAGILAGLAYGWLYMRSGNLWTAVIAHSTTNFLLGVWVLSTGSWHYW